MLKTSITLVLLLAVCALTFGCGGEAPEEGAAADTPAAAIQSMLALAEAGDWQGYVTQHYGEQHKLTKPAEQIAQLAGRIQKDGPKLIEMLKGCADKEPVLSADGKVATWPNGFRLHKDGDTWGFHL